MSNATETLRTVTTALRAEISAAWASDAPDAAGADFLGDLVDALDAAIASGDLDTMRRAGRRAARESDTARRIFDITTAAADTERLTREYRAEIAARRAADYGRAIAAGMSRRTAAAWVGYRRSA